MKIGIAGLGRMGSAIARRLRECGHDVTVWNRSGGKVEALLATGATAAVTPAALAAASEAVITILTDDAAIEAVYGGAQGLLSGDVRGKLFIEMSTVQPQTEVALAQKVTQKGADFVECPVGGTVGPALSGKLLGLVGGTAEAVQRARPVHRPALPPRGPCRSSRRRRQHEAGDQPAAGGVLAELRRGRMRCAVTSARTLPGWWSCFRTPPAAPTC